MGSRTLGGDANGAWRATRLAGYSPAVAADVLSGQLVFVSGQIARTAGGEVIGRSDPREQAGCCFDQIAALLESAGGTLSDVTRLVYYMTNIDADLPAVCEIRDTYDWVVPPRRRRSGLRDSPIPTCASRSRPARSCPDARIRSGGRRRPLGKGPARQDAATAG